MQNWLTRPRRRHVFPLPHGLKWSRRAECAVKNMVRRMRYAETWGKHLQAEGRTLGGTVYPGALPLRRGGVRLRLRLQLSGMPGQASKTAGGAGDAPEQAASLTLAQAAGRFLADREKQLKESTRARYAYLLRHYILPGLGETSVGQLTANGISDFLGGLQRGGLSGKSARDVGVLLKSVLKYSTRRLECSCPGLEAELPVYRRKQVSVFSADEVQRLARWVLSAPDGTGVAVLLALNTGLRLGELCALQFGDIDLKSGVVRVSKTVQRIPGEGGTRLAVQPPKSDSSRRAVPLPGDMAALLNRLPRSDSAQRYFLTGTDTPMEPRTMQYRYRALLKAAGITYRNFHALRHTYASRCIERGVDVKSLSEMLGHADVRTTLQFYVHSSMEHKLRVIQNICFLESSLKEDFSPSPPPSGGTEAEQFRALLSKLPQMG